MQREIYNKYVLRQLILKHSFHVLDVLSRSNQNWTPTTNKVGDIEIRHLWHNEKVVSFEEFCTLPENNWHSFLYWKSRQELLNKLPDICSLS